MIALAIGLAALSATLTGFVILQGVWLHSSNRDTTAYADHLDGQRKLVAEYKSKYDVEFAAHAVTQRELEQEKQLRAVAEAQRNEAQRRVQDLLRSHMASATENEIRALTAAAFASPLSVVAGGVQPSKASADRASTDLARPGD